MNLPGHQACTWYTYTQAGKTLRNAQKIKKPFKRWWEMSLSLLSHLVSLSIELRWMRSAVWKCLYVTIIVSQDDCGTQRLCFPNVHMTVGTQVSSPIDLLENDRFPAATVCHQGIIFVKLELAPGVWSVLRLSSSPGPAEALVHGVRAVVGFYVPSLEG